jgi:hypothetical protein
VVDKKTIIRNNGGRRRRRRVTTGLRPLDQESVGSQVFLISLSRRVNSGSVSSTLISIKFLH